MSLDQMAQQFQLRQPWIMGKLNLTWFKLNPLEKECFEYSKDLKNQNFKLEEIQQLT